ncbi:DUF3139 domain-containing protein [Listeria monocytogenes]|nr:DUF3139 domain-containing protein [Listeria monocytogenes]
MTKRKKILVLSLAIVGVLVIGGSFFLYTQSSHKKEANNQFESYTNKQGISPNDIEKKSMEKDYKQGGYILNVIFKDDPAYTYEYIYMPNNDMTLLVFKDNVGVDSGMKHEPLK